MPWWSWIKRVLEHRLSSKQTQLMAARGTDSAENFVLRFGPDGDIAEAVWKALSREAVVEGFKPRPDDDLLRVFGLADEDLEDVALEVMNACGGRLPSPEEAAKMKPVRTVAELVEFVSRMRRP